jgi:hypothetical protein
MERWPTLYFHLRYERPDEAVEWLGRVFGFRVVETLGPTTVLEGPAGGTVVLGALG